MKARLSFVLMALVAVAATAVCLVSGSVEIPISDVWGALMADASVAEGWRAIVVEVRVPMVLTALTAGAALAVAGLLLQTCFNNPLAGPSILGVSTGASLGVALVMLALGGVVADGLGLYGAQLTGALVGAAAVIAALLLFSRFVGSPTMLLIVGVLVGYFASSAIALLNFYSTQEGVYSYTIWGLGSFAGGSLGRSGVFALLTLPVVALSMLFVKPLNALLLGARYARSVGVNVGAMRTMLLLVSGVLTAFVTAFCGPIGFVGLIVPHLARMLTGTSNHTTLLPATALCGAALGLMCAALSVVFGAGGVVPINAITPIIGVPVVIYVMLNRKRYSV